MTEQLIFPEIDYDKVASVRGMDITIVTTARDDDEGRALLRALGFPFAGMAAVSASEKARSAEPWARKFRFSTDAAVTSAVASTPSRLRLRTWASAPPYT